MKRFFLLLIIFTSSFCGYSQNFAPSHLKAAGEVLDAAGIKENFDEMVTGIMSTQSKQLPEENREKFMSVMKAFISRYFSYDILKPKLQLLYASEFSEQELKEVAAFYKTSTGKKMASKLAVLQQKGADLGLQAVREHKDELEKMMSEAFSN